MGQVHSEIHHTKNATIDSNTIETTSLVEPIGHWHLVNYIIM